MTRHPLRQVSLAAALAIQLLPLAPTSAQAQTTAPERLDPVTVTGSRNQPRTVLTSPVPIDVLSADDIRASGQTDTSKVLQALLPSFNFPHPTTPDGNTHVRSATLRGLSPDQTLVLVNGKRRHTSAWVNTGGTVGKGAVSIDLNAIPVNAIERIEVLRDGASAQYGSDAIAGVINIVLRKDSGFSASVSGGASHDGGGDQGRLSLNQGFSLDQGGLLHLSAGIRERKAANRAEADTRQQYFGLGSNGKPVALSGAYGSGTGLVPIGGAAAGAKLDPREAGVDRKSLWRFADSADTQDRQVFFNAQLPLNDAGLAWYAFGGAANSEGKSNASLRRPGQPENVRALYPDGFLPWVDTDNNNRSLGTGLRGDLAQWVWDLSTVYGSNGLSYRTRNTVNATLGTASPKAFYNGRLDASQWTSNVDLRRSFDAPWQAPLNLALGAEYRRDSYGIGAGELASYQWGPARVLDGPAAGTVPIIGSQGFAGIQPGDAGKYSRRSGAVYGEVDTELGPRLTLSTALRHERFGDFGNTTKGKLALRYEPVSGLGLRASASNGFHAPALAQQFFSSTSSRTLNNPLTGLPEFVLVRTAPVGSNEARALGAQALKPEQANSLSTGVTWGQQGLVASLDLYRISIKDRIFLSSNFVDAGSSTAIRDYLAKLGSPGVSSVRYFTNAADTRTTGLDLSVRQTWQWSEGTKLVGTAAYNRNKTTLTRVAGTPAALSALGVRTPLLDVTERTRIETGQPKDKLILGARWEQRAWSVDLGAHRYGEIRAVAATNQSAANVAEFAKGSTRFVTRPTEAGAAGNVDVIQILEPKWVADVAVGYRFNKQLKLTLGVNNLFNIYPTRNIATTATVSGADTFGVFPYSELSPFGWSGAQYYARAELKF